MLGLPNRGNEVWNKNEAEQRKRRPQQRYFPEVRERGAFSAGPRRLHVEVDQGKAAEVCADAYVGSNSTI